MATFILEIPFIITRICSQPAQQFVPLPEPGMPASWFRMRSLPMEIRLMIDDLVTYFPIAGTNDSPPLFRTVKTGNYLTDLAWNSPRFDLRGDNLTLRPSDVAQYNSNTPPVNGRFLYLYRGIRLIYDRSASFGVCTISPKSIFIDYT